MQAGLSELTCDVIIIILFIQ